MTTKNPVRTWARRALLPGVCLLYAAGPVRRVAEGGAPLTDQIMLWFGLLFLVALPFAIYASHGARGHQMLYLSPNADAMIRLTSTRRGTWTVDQHVKLPGADAAGLRVAVLAGLLPVARSQGVRITLRAAGNSLAKTYAADVAKAQEGHPEAIKLKPTGKPGLLGTKMTWDPAAAS
ncbi:hypothetical protein [Oerskovia merdavium]|uniref:PH domain-containing protein n=1 Tax=Oerskovia merdavium TaxID=2762227 RepID=A0ABR8U3Z8_9CELL|nr:hypothetical protein [Oerskovia merdavium]MBD7982757.1 hypothetical protein [Oerskovia merdavium]